MTEMAGLQLTVAARVAEQLRAEIRRGALLADEPLRQNDIATRMGVSSTPVREAFQILERDGLVVREGRRGVRVFRPSTQDLIDGYEVRGALEALASRLAAVRVSDEGLAELSAMMDRMHAPRTTQQTFLRLNAQFHGLIARCSGNDRLAGLVVSEQAATNSFVVFLGVDPTSAHEAQGEHEAIFDAIRQRDPDAAAQAMSAHLLARVEALRTRLTAGRAGEPAQSPRSAQSPRLAQGRLTAAQ